MTQKLEHREQRIAFEELLGGMRQEDERVERLEKAIREAVPEWSLVEVVVALQAMRGIDLIAAVTVLAEIGDLSRFQNPRELMGYLMPSPRAATSAPGLASCLSKSPPAKAPSSARFPNEVIGTCAHCSSRLPASCLLRPATWQRIASSPGSPRQRSGCTTTSWRSRSPTSSRALPGASSITAATSR